MHINKNSSNCERYSLFITTFFSHASVMYMLSSYFFIKKDLMKIFHMTETELGIADGFRQFGSILGSVLLLVMPIVRQKYVSYYFTNKILFALMFLIIPFLQIFDYTSKHAIYLINLLIGIFRSSFWALLIMILHTQRQKLEKQQSSSRNFKLFLGIWASSYDFGTIFGFFFSSFIVYNLKYDWIYCLYLGCIFCIAMAFIVLFTSHIDQYKEFQESQSCKKQTVHLTICQILKKFMALPTNILFMLVFYLQRQISFQINMVVPVFLAQDGYLGYEGIIPATSNIFALMGIISFAGFQYFIFYIRPNCSKLNNPKVLGQHQQIQNQKIEAVQYKNIQIQDQIALFKQEKPHPRCIFSTSFFIFILCLVCLSVALYSKYQNFDDKKNPIIMGLFICLIRFFLGGPQNVNSSLTFMDVIETVSENHNQKDNQKNQEIKRSVQEETDMNFEKSVTNNKSSVLLGVTQSFTYTILILGIIAGSYFVEHYVRFYFFWLFSVSLLLFFSDFGRNLIIYKKNMQKRQIQQQFQQQQKWKQ